MKLRIQAYSDKGCIRDGNEDMLSVAGILVRDGSLERDFDITGDDYFYLFVADGMGGHEKGEFASQYLLEHLRDSFSFGDFGPVGEFAESMGNSVHYVNDKLNARAVYEGQTYPMGCTLSGVVWYFGRVFLLNAGDSRTYRWRDGLLTQLTVDETERGLTGNPEASKLLLNCIGGGSKGNVKVEDITDRLLEGDMLLICSDGLTDMVPDEEIERIMAEDAEPALGLVERAKDNGGEDNVSVIVAMVGDYDFAPGPYDDDGPDDDGRFDAWV